MIINKIMEHLQTEIPDTHIKDHFGDPVLIYKSTIWLCWLGTENDQTLCINSSNTIKHVDLKSPDALHETKRLISEAINNLDARIKKALEISSTRRRRDDKR